MTKKERMHAYKKALLDYRLSYIPFLSILLSTNKGLCMYFSKNFSIDLLLGLNELLTLKPKKCYKISLLGNRFDVWFKFGKLSPRIKLLKQTIKLCKEAKN